MKGYKVEYSADGNQVCIIPDPLIPLEDFTALSKAFMREGFDWWLPADERRGYIFSKTKPKDKNEK